MVLLVSTVKVPTNSLGSRMTKKSSTISLEKIVVEDFSAEDFQDCEGTSFPMILINNEKTAYEVSLRNLEFTISIIICCRFPPHLTLAQTF